MMSGDDIKKHHGMEHSRSDAMLYGSGIDRQHQTPNQAQLSSAQPINQPSTVGHYSGRVSLCLSQRQAHGPSCDCTAKTKVI